ncbi:MAG: hypothetical protein KJ970_11905 [Candidatus Eisenbacteria bacterium]|uniref:Uncharacterized protein n=1 Tax=Eiseniibacteriota bacterium TaxID=2212470 RepID=A0A948RVH4_UNCEI|nr:hypothetical protein [Candidatus Eisenbacteria bacterium]MBU1948078.1 hypothetical protein [Candidatus Eisenbacteria bacterium]MBU2691620.1 hypothetical protein [Candidatus Eisenbacteria bacterium]
MGNDETKNLDLLSTFHYVAGGITALLSLVPIIHLVLGIIMMSGDLFESSDGSSPPPVLGLAIVILATIFIVFGLALSVCMIIVGKKLKVRESRIFCMIIAGIECVLMPYGTVLGVFTLMTLSKDPVKAVFEPTGGGGGGGGAFGETRSTAEKQDGIVQ